ncbi:replicative helicase [Caudoviricetes sp.]|nr:replicative helicase [Caudoviricetes sp.]
MLNKNESQSLNVLVKAKEQELLATALDGHYKKIADIIKPIGLSCEDFLFAEHRDIWQGCLALEQEGKFVDFGTVIPKLTAKSLDALAGLVNRDIVKGVKACSDPQEFIEIIKATADVIKRASTQRKINKLIEAVARETEPQDQVQKLKDGIEAIGLRESNQKNYVTVASMFPQILAESEMRHKAGGGLIGLSTGIQNLDSITGGLKPSTLVVLGARPAMGKTTVLVNMASSIAKAGKRVLLFSLEMSSAQISTRVLSTVSEVPFWEIEKGEYAKEDAFSRLLDAERNAIDLGFENLMIDDTTSIDIAELANRAKQTHKDGGLDCVMVDYLSIVGAKAMDKRNNTVQSVTYVAERLKALAKDLKIPVVVLSQLSRKVEEREDKRPIMADLRESGGVEQAADVVMFLYREEYYHAMTKAGSDPAQWELKQKELRGRAELIIGKNRTGETGVAHLKFRPAVSEFVSDTRNPHVPENDTGEDDGF